MTELSVTKYLTYWRSIGLGSREILEGLVAEEHAGPSPDLARELAAWHGHYYWESGDDGRWLILIQEATPPPERWWLHAALLALTILTTSMAGAAFTGNVGDLLTRPSLEAMKSGLTFSLPLLAILLAHESGHYVTARRYRVNASPPYFIPFPPQLNVLGTMGAFIRLRSAVFDRRTLFDIGAAGPLAGLLLAVPILAAGLALSVTVPGAPGAPLAHQFVVVGELYVLLGDSLLLGGLRALLAPDGVLHLHPLAVAGWVGVLVTMLNMLPLAQLDGGHITFALFGRAQIWIARACWVALVLMGWLLWSGWWVWAALGLLLGRGRLRHPRVISPERGIGLQRRRVGYLAIVVFILCFMPVPILIP